MTQVYSVNQNVFSNQIDISAFEDTAVTIYQNTAQFTDFFTADIKATKTTLKYGPLLDSLQANTAFINIEEGSGEIVSQSMQKKKFNFDQFCRELTGKVVVLEMEYDFVVEGILVNQDQKSFTVYSEEQGKFEIIDKKSVLRLSSPDLKDAIACKPCLNAHYVTDQYGEMIKGAVTYLAKGLMWNPNYRLILTESEDTIKGKWVSEAQITNNTKIAFTDLIVNVVGGRINEENAPAPYSMARHHEMKTLCVNSSAGSVAIEQDWQDLKAYALAQKVSLLPQETFSARLYDPQTVDVTKKYVLESHEYQSGEQSPKVCFEIDNDESSKMNLALPSGGVQIYKQGKGSFNYLGSDTLAQTRKGDKVSVVSGQAYDLKSSRSVHSEPIRNREGKVIAYDITVKYELSNSTSKPQTIIIKDKVQKIVWLANNKPEIMPIENDKELIFEVTVDGNTTAKDPKTFTYSYRKPVA